MTNQVASYEKKSKVVLVLSIAVFVFWLLGKATNVYRFSFAGAIFEILWLPIIALTFVLPIFSLVFWRKEKFDFRLTNLVSIVILAITILVIFLNGKMLR